MVVATARPGLEPGMTNSESAVLPIKLSRILLTL